MIFATTGTQLAFPRLMAALDALAADLGEPIVAQAGPEPDAAAVYRGLDIRTLLSPEEYDRTVAQARLIVAHAGIGTILTAQQHNKPLILVPRRFALGEHRNDHQIATARQVADLEGIHVAWEVDDIGPLLFLPYLSSANDLGDNDQRVALTTFIRDWIMTGGSVPQIA